MEDKLLELKDQFCKWYCVSKGKEVYPPCSGVVYCEECESDVECHDFQRYFNYCENCQVSEYIRYIRDELN